MPVAVFRADAGAAIGGGHVVRCLALASALASVGWNCLFACRKGSAEAVPELARAGHGIVPLDDEDDEPARIGAALPGGAVLLVVDHYGRDAAFERACRGWAERILVLDDFTHRPHDADFLLNSAPGVDGADYAGKLPDGCRLLLGPSFALLRPQFLAARRAALARRDDGAVRRVLVAVGATDPADVTSRSLAALEPLDVAPPDIAIDVVLGGAAPHRAAVAGRLPPNATLHLDAQDMASLMTEADIAIGAPGSGAWERCCLGLPSIAVVSADNQRSVGRALAGAGAAAVVEDESAASIAAALRGLAASPERRRAMAGAAASLCDGRGTWRAMLALLPPRTLRDGTGIRLRLAEPGDEAMMLAWQSDPRTRAFARNPAIPGADEHRAWFARSLADPGRILTVIEQDGEPAGVLRLDRRGDGIAYEISILVAPDRYGRGIGAAALALARDLAPGAELRAEVLPGNAASLALFRRAGYLPAGDHLHLSRPNACRPDA